MKSLSPSAQAVLDATDYPEDWATRIRVAAALRALDSQLGYEVLGVRCVDCSQLQIIAAELEALP